MTDTAGQDPTPATYEGANADALRANKNLRTLVEEFTGWTPWHSTDGTFYATRVQALTEDELNRGLYRVVCGTTPQELAAEIRTQMEYAAAKSGPARNVSRF